MKKLSLFLCLTLMLSFVFGTTGAFVSAEKTVDDVISYDVNVDVTTEPVEIKFTVEQDGEYALGLEYKPLDEKTAAYGVAIRIDGEYPSEALESYSLPRYWTTTEPYREDSQGNQAPAAQVLYDDYVTYYLLSTENYNVKEYKFSLAAGEHTLTITPTLGQFNIKSLKLDGSTDVASYTQPTGENYTGGELYFEGESADLKSSYWLNTASDLGSFKVHPADAVKAKINYIGGANWKQLGETIYWTVNVPQSGYYNLGFSYRQSYVLNGNVYRWLRVNGETPFAEATSVAFPYVTDWDVRLLGKYDGETVAPYSIYLEKGDNQISLMTSMGEYSVVCNDLEGVVALLQDLYLDITMVTGETVDIYRDYRLFDQIPQLQERLEKAEVALAAAEEKLIALAGGEASDYSSTVNNMRTVVKDMLDNRFDAHRYKSNFYNNYSSVSAMLNDIQNMPLDIDRLILTSGSATTVASEDDNFFSRIGKSLVFGVQRFIASFTEDYNNISGDTSDKSESVTVWVNWGRDQAQVLNRMVREDFVAKNPSVGVSIKITNATIIQGVLSGNGPDVILEQPRTEPVNLAMRGVLYDLNNFSDVEEVKSRFHDGATDPYIYKDGLYALPDTQNFQMMFYRTDVFEELELDVPKTWDEFKTVSRLLSRNNLSSWMPYTQLASLGVVNIGIGNLNMFPTLLIQNDLSLYSEDLRATSFTEPEVIEVFSDWTDYYTKLKMPYQLDFLTRFRLGTTPIGIAPYTMYNTLTASAKEIDGKWEMVAIPGIMREDGTINNASAGSGSGCGILKNAKSYEAAWTFLKWWTHEDTQLSYSNNVEAILGPVSRMAVANKNALEKMSWDSETYAKLDEAWNKVVEIREVPGSYYVSRSLDFAFWNVASMNKNPKDMLQTWGEEADAEIKRKWEQYENR